ncbi:MAG: helix-turn-helix domain-containing protein [Candidatus Kerfeldbacteria bacterium]|nr:helix-turn-helix domain-containing protein [Candidatus Kerfeldbacteria bacterium]
MELFIKHIRHTFEHLPFEFSIIDVNARVLFASQPHELSSEISTLLLDRTIEVLPLQTNNSIVGYTVLHEALSPREKMIIEQYIKDIDRHVNHERQSILQESKRSFWKHVLYGDLQKDEFVEFIHKFNIPNGHTYANAFLKISPAVKCNDDILQLVQQVFNQYMNEFAMTYTYTTGFGEIAVLMELSPTKRSVVPKLRQKLKVYASNILKQLHAHPQLASAHIIIGVSEEHYSIEQLSPAFISLKNVVRIAARLYKKSQLFLYESIPMYVILSDISPQAANSFVQLVCKHLDKKDDQLFASIQALLDNDLNVSRAAKSLGIHRHTLEYRLHAIQKQTDMNPASFEYALQFGLAMMLKKLHDI